MKQTARNWLFILLATFLGLALIALIFIGNVYLDLGRIPWILLVPAATVFALGHSWFALGWQRALALFACMTTIGFSFELLGTRTGIIFGPYCYTPLLGYKLAGEVPWLIPLAWYMMAYPSYLIANLLATGSPVARPGRSKWLVLVVAILGAGLMTAWDLTMDPIMSYEPPASAAMPAGIPATSDWFVAGSTVGNPAWRWTTDVVPSGACATAQRLPVDQPRTYFDIPWRNFFGWMLTSTVAFLLFGLLERRLTAPPVRELSANPKYVPERLHSWVRADIMEKAYWLMPLSFYLALAIIDSILGPATIEDVHLIAPFLMGIPATAAALLVFHQHSADDRKPLFFNPPRE